QVNGVPTDVIPVGDLAALALPTSCGVSVGHFMISAGTLGCLVQSTAPGTGDHFILSNNHVLANTNSGTKEGPGVPGDDIWEPGPLDGGMAPAIAQLTDFEPIVFGSLPAGSKNTIDAAIARVLN